MATVVGLLWPQGLAGGVGYGMPLGGHAMYITRHMKGPGPV